MENVILKTNAVANIRTLTESGHTQEEIAKWGGVSRVQINRILNGHSWPESDTCEAIATAIGLHPISLYRDPVEFESLLIENLVTSS